MVKIRVLVADDQTLFCECIDAMLKTCNGIEVVGEATNGKETIEMARELTPDIVLMNLSMPIVNGDEVARRVRKENNNVKVLFLTQYEDKDRILSGLKAGANGYIPKRATASELVSAILAVYHGGCFLYPSVAKTVVDDYFQRIRRPATFDPYDRLTHREREVLKLMTEGHKNREIANLLDIAVKTALVHRTSVMRKLGIHNRTELIRYAIRKQLINLSD